MAEVDPAKAVNVRRDVVAIVGGLSSLTVERQLVFDGQGVDLSERPTRVLREPSIIEELHGPGPALVSGTRFDALLVSAVSSNHRLSCRCGAGARTVVEPMPLSPQNVTILDRAGEPSPGSPLP